MCNFMDGWITVQKTSIQLLVHRRCWMNQWIEYCTEKFRSSIRPPDLMDELMDQYYRTMENICPSTVQQL